MSKFAEAYADVLQKEMDRKRRMRVGFWMTLAGTFIILLGLAISYSSHHVPGIQPWKIIGDTATADSVKKGFYYAIDSSRPIRDSMHY